MGLFDKLKSAVGEAVQDAVKDVVSQIAGDTPDKPGAPTAPVNQSPEPMPVASGARADRSTFRGILADGFPELTVRENVPVQEFGGEGKPYDFALYRDGKAVGLVMLTEHNRDNNRAFKGAKASAAAAKVPFINFYLHMPNERGYVSDRIRSLLLIS